ncbi:vWA domain-containing protein [Pelagibius litoralis]|nr:VWA domain-containing protein [Pelagibius litoralis]
MQVTRFPARAAGTTERMADFMAHLRANGLPVGPPETGIALKALTTIKAWDAAEARLALKAICAGDAERFERFDDLFEAYWLNSGRERQGFATRDERRTKHQVPTFGPGVDRESRSGEKGALDQPEGGDDSDGFSHSGDGKLVASRLRNIEKVDLRELMMPEDLKRAERVAERFGKNIRDRRSRRRKAARRGAQLDLRRIARASVSAGGEPIRLLKRRRPDRPVHLVALLDVSGSMTVYARVFLAFLKGLMSADQRTDAYLFHTRLVPISDALRDHDSLRAVNRLSLLADGFGGGTRIGANLAQFNAQYAAQRVNGRSVVVILSDGYDTDPPAMIATALQRLKKRGCRIVWLNPLKGWKDYAPVAAGMAAALPYLDLFAPANTLESLAALEPQLQRL